MSYRHRDDEAKADVREFLRGAVPEIKPQWGSIALGATLGYLMGREIRKAARR